MQYHKKAQKTNFSYHWVTGCSFGNIKSKMIKFAEGFENCSDPPVQVTKEEMRLPECLVVNGSSN